MDLFKLSEGGGLAPPSRPRMQNGKAHVQEVEGHATEDHKQIRTPNT